MPPAGGDHKRAVIGGSVAAVLIILAAAAIAFIFMRRRQRQNLKRDKSMADDASDAQVSTAAMCRTCVRRRYAAHVLSHVDARPQYHHHILITLSKQHDVYLFSPRLCDVVYALE